VLGSYRRAEKIFLLLSLVFLAYPISMVLADPDWGEVAKNTLWPHFVNSQSFLFLAVAIIGTTITPYMQLYQAAAVADRGIGPDEYPQERIDTIAGSVFANLIAMSIIIATAATIGGSGALESADQAAKALQPVAGASAETLFALGLLGASLLAAAIVPLSTAYGVAEAVGAERSVSRRFREAPLFLGLLFRCGGKRPRQPVLIGRISRAAGGVRLVNPGHWAGGRRQDIDRVLLGNDLKRLGRVKSRGSTTTSGNYLKWL